MIKRIVFLLLLVAAMPAQSQTQGSTGAGFTGAGSTFAFPIIARWGQAFAALESELGAVSFAGLDYEPVGSLGGVLRVIQGGVEFGASDVPLSPPDLERHGLIQFPIVTGGIAVVVNLPGVASNSLRLSGSVLARIFLGNITRWSDPSIAALNPGVALPDAPIVVLHREDGSGTTYNFASYLAGVSEDWRQLVGVDSQLRWPVGTGARGNAQLAERVQATPNAIGYVDVSQVARLGLRAVLVENRAGQFVSATPAALQAALSTAAWDPARHFHQVALAPTAADAYPITATVYALMQRNPASRTRARQAVEFFRFALSGGTAAEQALRGSAGGGDHARALGYVPLPPTLVTQVETYWRTSAR